MQNNIFKLYATCIPVKGIKRSIICNIWKSKFRYIPNTLYHILNEYEGLTKEKIKKKFDNNFDGIIDSYFDFLQENDFGFYCSQTEFKLFPKLNLNFEKPFLIGNCIIDISKDSHFNYQNIYKQLSDLNCHYYQFRFYDNLPIIQISNILPQSKDFHIRSISIIMPFDSSYNKKQIIEFYKKFPITEINFHSTPKNKINYLQKKYNAFPFNYFSTKINNELHCGKISIDSFNTNITSFSESQSYNTCLNRKISINSEGEIKNCPSMNESFGNIKHTTLREVIENPNFKVGVVIERQN